MPEISPMPTIAVTIGRETHLYHAYVTTAPARLDGPRTMTLYVGTFAEVSGWATSQLPCDAARANTPTRVVLVEATERHWHRTSYRGEGHVFAETDSILCLNTLQHWLWQRLYAPIVSDVGGYGTAAHSRVERQDASHDSSRRSEGDHHVHDRIKIYCDDSQPNRLRIQRCSDDYQTTPSTGTGDTKSDDRDCGKRR